MHNPNSPVLTAFAKKVGLKFLENQAKLDELNGWIQSQPGWESAGYINEINNAHNLSTTLLWSGASALQKRALAKALSLGIHATVQQRPMNLLQINAAEAKIMNSKAAFAARGFDLSTVIGVQASTSELELEGTMSIAPKSAAFAPSMASVSSLGEQLAGQPVQVGTHIKPVSAVGVAVPTPRARADLARMDDYDGPTRQSDTSPHSAGAYMVNDEGHTCSTGFTLSTVVGPYTTTARHCLSDSSGYEPDSGYGDSFGAPTATTSDGEASLLSGAGQPYAYDGAADDPDGYSKAVVGIYDPGLHDLLCTGGGNSGEHCDVEIFAFNLPWDDGTGNGYVSTVYAEDIDSGDMAAIQGDSGGPVISLSGLDPYGYQVNAVGMIQAVDPLDGTTGSGCGDVIDAGDNVCSPDILFTLTDIIINDGGLDVALDTTE